ncbi:MAG: hypothetical protein JO159_09130 [Acidobacteria bacterium]|nr:hypothetical protein [Acidobacteriota bacterium]
MGASKNPIGAVTEDRLFTSLLSSAYSLQQQHDRIRSKLPAPKFSEIIAEVIDTQSLIRKRKLDSETAMHLIANRTQKLSAAAGAAIALVAGQDLDYKVGTGIAVALPGLKIGADESISFERLKWGQFVETDTWQDKALATRLVAKVLSAPIYRYGTLAGCIQLFSRHGRFDTDGIYVCELMAGVVSHLIGATPSLEVYERHTGTSIPGYEPAAVSAAGNRAPAGNATSRTRLRWGLVPRESKQLEPRNPNPAMLAGNAGEATATLHESDSGLSTYPANGSEPHSASLQNQLEPLPDINDLLRQLEDTDVYRQEALPPGLQANASVRHSALAPSNGHTMYGEPASAEEYSERRTAFDSVDEFHPADNQLERQDQTDPEVNGMDRRTTWRRVKPVIYPVFVLLFAIFVRISAGPHGWPLEIVIYILLVLTTLELRNRLSKP